MLINQLIKNTIKRIDQSADDKLSDLSHSSVPTLVKDLREYLEWVLENPGEFATSVGSPTRELYAPKDIIEAFNESCDYDTTSYLYVSRILPASNFAYKGKSVPISRITGKPQSKKFFAIKNQVMWHNASLDAIIEHLRKTGHEHKY